MDRNKEVFNYVSLELPLSLSARRAWIEISNRISLASRTRSLSARRAWIEISVYCDGVPDGLSRSPQGERG